MHNLYTIFSNNRIQTTTGSILDLHYFSEFEEFLRILVTLMDDNRDMCMYGDRGFIWI